jgi:hypothetical protein
VNPRGDRRRPHPAARRRRRPHPAATTGGPVRDPTAPGGTDRGWLAVNGPARNRRPVHQPPVTGGSTSSGAPGGHNRKRWQDHGRRHHDGDWWQEQQWWRDNHSPEVSTSLGRTFRQHAGGAAHWREHEAGSPGNRPLPDGEPGSRRGGGEGHGRRLCRLAHVWLRVHRNGQRHFVQPLQGRHQARNVTDSTNYLDAAGTSQLEVLGERGAQGN